MYNSQNIPITLSNIQNETIKNEENRSGFYRAIVISNKDPLNIARVKVRIPCFHGTSSAQSFYTPDDGLPYAWPGVLNNASYQSGQYLVPLEGSTVWVSFETGTSNMIYFGGIYSTAPTSEKYLYFDRGVNHGDSKLITEDDIPVDYNTNKYIIYRSPKGACIYIDDRDVAENITIKDSHGNSVILNKNGVTIDSENYVKAKYPYYNSYYISVNEVNNKSSFIVDKDKVFIDEELTGKVTNILKGSRVLYLNNDKEIMGSGILVDYNMTQIRINSNGVYK